MFIELMFATLLDVSLPEFQPEIDASGNVIVSEIDDISGDIIAVEMPLNDIPVDDNFNESVNEIDDMSFGLLAVNGTDYLSLTTKRNCEIKNESGQYYIRYRSSYNYYIQYTLLQSGVTYDIDKNGAAYIGLSVDNDTEVFLIDSTTYTPSTDIYIMQYHHDGYYLNVSVSSDIPDDPSGNDPDDPSGNDPDNMDYTTLINAVNDVNASVNVCAYILLFMAFCPFLTKIVDKLMYRKED